MTETILCLIVGALAMFLLFRPIRLNQEERAKNVDCLDRCDKLENLCARMDASVPGPNATLEDHGHFLEQMKEYDREAEELFPVLKEIIKK